MRFLLYFSVAVIAYMIGSISTAIIIGRIYGKEDIRTKGSKNAGATNVLRNYGKVAALLVLLGDILKTAIAILIAMYITKLCGLQGQYAKIAVYIASVFAVLGHNFPVYFGFKGGKGVACSITAVFFTNPIFGIIVLIFAVAVMAITKYVSLGSMLGAILFVVLVLIFENQNIAYIVFSVILCALLIFMHRENIKRLLNHTENKLSLQKKN